MHAVRSGTTYGDRRPGAASEAAERSHDQGEPSARPVPFPAGNAEHLGGFRGGRVLSRCGGTQWKR